MPPQGWPLVLYQIFVQGSVGVFLTLGALLLLSRYRGEYVREYTRIALVGCCLVACLAGLAGLMTIVSMRMVYMLNARPAWNNPATMMTFLTTTMLLGVLTAGVIAGGDSLTAGRRVPALASLLSREYTPLGL